MSSSEITERALLRIFRSAPALLLVLKPDAEFTMVEASDEWLRAAMTTRERIVGRGVFEAFPASPRDPLAKGVVSLSASLNRVVRTKRPDAMGIVKYDIPRPGGERGEFEERYWRTLNAPILDGHGELEFIVLRTEDVTEHVYLTQVNRKQREQATALEDRAHQMELEVLQRSRELAVSAAKLEDALAELSREKHQIEAILLAIGDAVVTTDADGRIKYINAAAEGLTGWRCEETIGRTPAHVLMRDDGSALGWAELRRIAEEDGPSLGDYRLVRRDGCELTVAMSVSSVAHSDSEISGLTLVLRDVTEERRRAEALWHQARHDPLTGLVNRREFGQRMEHALEGARQGSSHVLCMIDLDGFKRVNDLGGHATGDEMLRQIARRMERSLRQRDTLARLGGDEFACLLEHCSLAQAERLAGDLRSAIQSVTVQRGGRSYQVDASFGLAPVSPAIGEVDALLRAADAACYAAKRSAHKVQVLGRGGLRAARGRGVTSRTPG
jgi:diguanylate cyclase (GGDEF)-like protein/PAS domain S-box-containing protein